MPHSIVFLPLGSALRLKENTGTFHFLKAFNSSGEKRMLSPARIR
jgi:hypothetical protein